VSADTPNSHAPPRGRLADRAGERPTGAVTSLEDPPLLTPDGLVFRDRHDAGFRLAARLEPFRAEHPVVVGIPRGGIPVAAEVARALGAPLDVAVVRKIGAPQNPEFAIGALAEGGVHILSESVVRAVGLSEAELRSRIEHAEGELRERIDRYRGAREPVEVAGRTVILIDDGLATGRSALAAIVSLRQRGAARVILAVPVAAPASVETLRAEADEVVCLEMPDDLWAVGVWYEDFRPTTDEEVTALLAENTEAPSHSAGPEGPVVRQVSIPVAEGVSLTGELSVPQPARGVVAFAHGSGSSRLSPRNRAVAKALNDAGFATLLFDLLTPSEEVARINVFDISLLASRLESASVWLRRQSDVGALPLCYFGASTGAAAALSAAAELGDQVSAVISRGGRPDLASNLGAVRAPTLLIVGGADRQVLQLNEDAQRQLVCASEIAIVEHATHLFEEPGALEQVCRLAVGWLDRHLG
jgi:putative phosphoribosyl transferase